MAGIVRLLRRYLRYANQGICFDCESTVRKPSVWACRLPFHVGQNFKLTLLPTDGLSRNTPDTGGQGN